MQLALRKRRQGRRRCVVCLQHGAWRPGAINAGSQSAMPQLGTRAARAAARRRAGQGGLRRTAAAAPVEHTACLQPHVELKERVSPSGRFRPPSRRWCKCAGEQCGVPWCVRSFKCDATRRLGAVLRRVIALILLHLAGRRRATSVPPAQEALRLLVCAHTPVSPRCFVLRLLSTQMCCNRARGP